jgi:16S rRNA processing protein RimM
VTAAREMPGVKWDEMALVGRVARPHGLRGQMILDPETDFPDERFQPGGELFVEVRGAVETLTLTSVRFHRGRPIVGIAGIESIERAQEFAGCELRIPMDALIQLPAAQFYLHELVGCDVETAGGASVGRVKRVDAAPGASRLVVEAPDGEEILVPFVTAICPSIDLPGRRIVIEPPAGLLELNRAGSVSA